jgi:hypothetical protein
MTVTLTGSKTIGGSSAADALAGGGSGIAFGFVQAGSYAPVTDQDANTGWQDFYLRHDAADDKITDVKHQLRAFSQTYGGAATSAANYSSLVNKGKNSSTSPNNADGLGAGLRVEQDADVADALGADVFDATRDAVKIYGKDNLGITAATAFDLHEDALVWNNAGTPVDATSPVAGEIGKAGDTVLGDTARLRFRFYLEAGALAPDNGTVQCDLVVSFSFTS